MKKKVVRSYCKHFFKYCIWRQNQLVINCRNSLRQRVKPLTMSWYLEETVLLSFLLVHWQPLHLLLIVDIRALQASWNNLLSLPRLAVSPVCNVCAQRQLCLFPLKPSDVHSYTVVDTCWRDVTVEWQCRVDITIPAESLGDWHAWLKNGTVTTGEYNGVPAAGVVKGLCI